MNKGLELLCCYSDQDQSLYQELRQQLSPFERQGLISTWSNADITAGTNWQEEVEKHLNTAEIILLLISPGFISSDYCYSQQLMRAMARHESGGARVIPVLLRPVHWKETPFSGLQVAPKNEKFVTRWPDPHEAFFEIVADISRAIEEVLRKKQARMRSLFGYEINGGKRSELWDNPNAASFDKKGFQAWYETKRDFRKEEIVGRTWLKITQPEYTFKVDFLENDKLRECNISDTGNDWEGEWKLLDDGTLRLNIMEFELDIFANREGNMHSGIEYKQGQATPWAHHILLPYRISSAKHWPLSEVADLVNRIFDQVLNRNAKQQEFIIYGSLLHRGEKSVRDIVKILGLSQEHMTLLNDVLTTAVIGRCYEQFLGRVVDPEGERYYPDQMKAKGVKWVINHLIDSNEYSREYGENAVPHKVSWQ